MQLAVSPEGNTRVRLSAEALKQAESRSAQAHAALLPDISGAISEQNMTRNLAALGIRRSTSPIPGFQIPTFVGPFSTLDARVSAIAEGLRFQLHPAIPGVEGGRERRRSRTWMARAEQVAAQVARAYLAALRADADVEAAKANVDAFGGRTQAGGEPEGGGHRHGHRDHAARVQLANDRQRLLVAENARRAAGLQLLRAIGLRLDTRTVANGQAAVRSGGRGDAGAGEGAGAEARAPIWRRSGSAKRPRAVRRAPSKWSGCRRWRHSAITGRAARDQQCAADAHRRHLACACRFSMADGARRGGRNRVAVPRGEESKTSDLKEQIELDVRLALDALRSAEEQVKVAREGLELAENELAQARRRYDAGVAIGVEVTDAQSRLERARDNQTAALYNYNVGRIDLAQAMGAVRGAWCSDDREANC